LVFCILLTRIVSIDLLWSDPEGQVETWAVSPRGGGYLFGSMPTNAVSIFTI
jgi:diadenosine tetraphosphatase ApaH/serine/threonine PP2A family protein phosphatase